MVETINMKDWEMKKKKIEKAKEEVSRNKGKKESIFARLEKEFACSSLDDAKAELNKLQDKKVKFESRLRTMLEELNEYDWDL